jgi:group II intron reverse transcriptase/maturase
VNLQANIEALAQRLQAQRYRAKLVRRCYIPKANGQERPLGISALEDKLVQLACAKLLTAIYEQDFLECSYGYRPGRGALDAVRDLTFDLQYGRYGYLVEADIQGFFDPMDHAWLLDMLRVRIDDRAFLKLIRKWLKAGMLETDGQVIHPETGTPQGGTVSPPTKLPTFFSGSFSPGDGSIRNTPWPSRRATAPRWPSARLRSRGRAPSAAATPS